MTLENAILHCQEIIDKKDLCIECKEEHKQLLNWLIELKEFKEQKTYANK